jgi:hypothetical protein
LLDKLDQFGIDHQRVIVEAGELDHVCLLKFGCWTEEARHLQGFINEDRQKHGGR